MVLLLLVLLLVLLWLWLKGWENELDRTYWYISTYKIMISHGEDFGRIFGKEHTVSYD